jgi:DNA-binding MarR family transcriptional regulator
LAKDLLLSAKRLRAGRLYLEQALALNELLDAALEHDVGIRLSWYHALAHLEGEPDGLRMNELAGRVSYSKSGLTRVVDALEREGLVRRVRLEHDRRSIFLFLTEEGRRTVDKARRHHHRSIDEHFSRHLEDRDVKALLRALEKIDAHEPAP